MKLLLVISIVVAVAGCAAETVSTTTTLGTATTPPIASTTTSSPDRVAAWNEDIDVLVERLELIHPNPYWRVGQEEFERQVAEIRDSIPSASDDEIELDLVRLMATIDGHTILPTNREPLSNARYQIRFYEFSDGVHVVESNEPALIGAELTAIGGTPVDQALAAVAPYVSHDNDQTILNVAPVYLVIGDVLADAGVIDGTETPAFELTTATGDTITSDPALLAPDEWSEWVESPINLPGGTGPVSFEDTDRPYWWRYLTDEKTVYIQYNLVQSGVDSMVTEIEELMSEKPVERIVIDVRRNPGGNNTTFGSLLGFLEDQAAGGEVDVLCLIGRQTFSAAANFVTRLDVESDTVFIGEGIGGSPNLYGDTVPVNLPNSGVQVLVSSIYWEFGGPDDHRETVEPDIAVDVSSSDYFGGVDPVLDAALAYDE